MTPTRSLLIAFGGSGALWILGGYAAGLERGVVLVSLAVAYVVLGTLALAFLPARMSSVLGALWGVAVSLVGTLFYLSEATAWSAWLVGLLVGTLLFLAWIVVAFTLQRFLGGTSEDR